MRTGLSLIGPFVLRHLWRDRLRSAVTVFGIGLGIAVVIAIRMANVSSVAGFEAALDVMSGRTSLEIVGSGFGLDELRLEELDWLRDFGVLSPVIEGDAVASFGRGAEQELVRVLGVDVLRDQPLREYQLIGLGRNGSTHRSGASASRAPEAKSPPDAEQLLRLLLDPRSVVLTEVFATRHGVTVGDRVTLVMGDREQSFEVRALLANEGPARVLDGNFALMDIAAAQWALDRLGRIDRVDLRLTDSATIDRAERTIASRLPAGLTVQRPERRGRQVEKMLSAFHANLTALSYIALLVGLFLVYNTVSTSVIVRRAEIGTLRALGATRRTVMGLFLVEALAFAVPGCLVGIGLGRLLAVAAVALTRRTVNTLYVATAAAPPALVGSDILMAAAIGVPLALLAALLPAAEGARVQPMAAIRGADRLEMRDGMRWKELVVAGAMLLLAAFLATRQAVGGLPLGGYGSALALVFGAAFLVPPVLASLAHIGRPVARLTGVAGWLAHANVAAAIPRLSVAVAALAVSLAMMVAIAVMIGSFRDTVIYWVGETMRADLFVGPSTRGRGARQATLSPEIATIVAGHPLVLAVDRFRNASVPYDDSQVFVNATDFEVLLAHGRLLFKSPADGRTALAAATARDAVAVSEAFALRHNKRVGDRVTLPAANGVSSFAIVAVFYDYASDRGQILMDRRTFARHFGDLAPTGLTVYLQPSADPDRVRADLLRAFGNRAHLFIFTNRSLRAEVLRVFDSTFAITYALEAIAIGVSILGVGATLLTLILERRKELAVLRLVGADRRQVLRMVVLEAAFIGCVSQAVGIPVGILLSLVLIFVVNVQSFGWTIQFHLPLAFLVQMSCLMLVATASAGIYPARLASRLSVATEVAEE